MPEPNLSRCNTVPLVGHSLRRIRPSYQIRAHRPMVTPPLPGRKQPMTGKPAPRPTSLCTQKLTQPQDGPLPVGKTPYASLLQPSRPGSTPSSKGRQRAKGTKKLRTRFDHGRENIIGCFATNAEKNLRFRAFGVLDVFPPNVYVQVLSYFRSTCALRRTWTSPKYFCLRACASANCILRTKNHYPKITTNFAHDEEPSSCGLNVFARVSRHVLGPSVFPKSRF